MRSLASILAAVLVCAAPPALAQPAAPATVSGMVIDADTRAPIASARVSANDTRVVADTAGRFTIAVTRGRITFLVEAAGYFPLATSLDVPAAGLAGTELSLARQTGFATSVDVVAAPPAAAPATAVRSRPSQVLRTPGALDNVFRTLQTLPGVAATEEFGSRLAVRGGSPDQNLTMMDGVEIHDPYRLFGLTSAFNPETIQRFELATGGFSAKYGDRLSSLLLVENRDGIAHRRRCTGSASLSITDANVVLEGSLPRRRGRLVAGHRPPHLLRPGGDRASPIRSFPPSPTCRPRASGSRRRAARSRCSACAAARPRRSSIDEDDARGEFQDDTDNDLAWARFDAALGAAGQSHTSLSYSNTRSTFGVDAAFENTQPAIERAWRRCGRTSRNVIFDRALACGTSRCGRS